MQLHTLKPKTKRTKSQSVGRGGKRGKTSGRGTKGQNARAGRKKRPELRDIIAHIPKLRGRGKSSFKSFSPKNFPVNLDLLEKKFDDGEKITLASLREKLNTRLTPKILGGGKITKKFTLEGVKVSESAKEKIEKAGGKII